jgi:hypothetical protein
MNGETSNSEHPTANIQLVGAVDGARKEVAQRAKDLVSAAQELQQLALIDEIPFEPDVALPPEEIQKRYTGTNGKRAAERREQVVKLLGLQLSARDICDVLRMSHHTVEAIAAQEAHRVAVLGGNVADALMASAMADFAVAETKRAQASPKDLTIMGGIKMTHATNLRMAGAALGDAAEAVELEAEDPRRLAFVERLKQLADKTKATKEKAPDEHK